MHPLGCSVGSTEHTMHPLGCSVGSTEHTMQPLGCSVGSAEPYHVLFMCLVQSTLSTNIISKQRERALGVGDCGFVAALGHRMQPGGGGLKYASMFLFIFCLAHKRTPRGAATTAAARTQAPAAEPPRRARGAAPCGAARA